MSDKISKAFMPVLIAIIAIIVIFNLVGSSSTQLTGGGDSITDANNCSEGVDNNDVALVYNITDKYCYNTSPDETGGKDSIAEQYDLPLNSLFSSNGIVLLILMAAVLLTIISIAMMKKKS